MSTVVKKGFIAIIIMAILFPAILAGFLFEGIRFGMYIGKQTWEGLMITWENIGKKGK